MISVYTIRYYRIFRKKKNGTWMNLFGINEFVIQLVYLTILLLIIECVVDVYLNADLPYNGVIGSWYKV